MRFIGIIPARMGSTRLPRKPLLDICGKPMIQHVYERAKKCLDIVYVATDSAEIYDTVKAFGGDVVMTPLICNSGTDRCYHAYQKITKFTGRMNEEDIIINIQGDQPMLHEDHIYTLKSIMNDPMRDIPDMATIAFVQKDINVRVKAWDSNKAFVTIDNNSDAMYFSRFSIPFSKDTIKYPNIYQHVGIYGFTVQALVTFFSMGILGPSNLEAFEGLEQLRWLENGRKIRVGITQEPNISVDTEEDLQQVIEINKIIKENDYFEAPKNENKD